MVAEVSQPWVEKYRPQKIDDVAHQEEVVSTLRNALETANMPHLLFYGPPGTGKTTTALAICRQLFGPALFKNRVLELNASDERGISVVRNKIKTFASSSVGRPDPEYPSPPYKILILDEADSMTQDAQNAMRRIMETHSNVTRFCFICNYVSRIIEPLASRCAKFRFKPLHEGIMTDRINRICGEEGVELAPASMATLSSVSHGDLRRAITTLQSAFSLAGNPVKDQALLDVSGEVPTPLVDSLMMACKQPAFSSVEAAVKEVFCEGYSVNAVLEQLLILLMKREDMSDANKAKVADAMATADKCLVDGADGMLQLQRVLSVLQQANQGILQ